MGNMCREGYRMTELGEIPQEWVIKSFGEILSFIKSGLSRQLKDIDVGIPCIRSSNIVEGKININDIKYWFLEDDKGANISDYVLQDGDILVNFINSIAQIGKTCIYHDIGRDAIYTTNIFRVKTNESIVKGEFFYYYTLTEQYNKDISLITKPAVNQASFTSADFKKILMPVPTLKEQQKIADILSTVDEQIEQTDALIEKTKELKKGLMQRLLTKGIGHTEFKQTEIGEIPVGWEVSSIEDVCKTTSGGTPSRKHPEYYENGNVFWVKTGELKNKYIFEAEEKITDEAIKNSSAKLLEPNMVLVAMYGATIGKTSILKVAATTNQACCAMIPKSNILHHEFLYYILSFDTEKLINMGAGGAQPNISQQLLKKYQIPLPPMDEQKEIVNILSEIDNQIGKLEEKASSFQNLKKSLMQQLLTGKIRVKL